jgi:Cu/Ag efflux protein CusF
MAVGFFVVGWVLLVSSSLAQSGTEFPGTVVMVDQAAGKLAVKKEAGGTRFTFVVNDKTQFEGPGLKSLKDIKKGDNVTVNYQVTGSQYVAVKVTKGK